MASRIRCGGHSVSTAGQLREGERVKAGIWLVGMNGETGEREEPAFDHTTGTGTAVILRGPCLYFLMGVWECWDKTWVAPSTTAAAGAERGRFELALRSAIRSSKPLSLDPEIVGDMESLKP